jgi:hypothetical protein
MTFRHRFIGSVWAVAGIVALGGPLQASAQVFDPTGTWRDENANGDDATTPRKEALPGQPDFNNNFHGTYRSRPYLLITLQDKGKPKGPYFIYSDVGDLRAELRSVAGAPRDLDIIDRRSGQKLGVLRTNADECNGRSPCFAFIGATSALGVPVVSDGMPVLYRAVGSYIPSNDPKLDQNFGSMFSPLSANFGYILKCWNLAAMDPTNYQNPGCGKDVFSMPGADSFGYNKVGFNNWHDAAVPFAWTYASALFQKGEERGRTWENGQDVMEADKLKVGVKVSVNVMGVEASSHVSVSSQSKVENMYDSKLTYSKAEYLSTQFALVLNKFYARLDPDLRARIELIQSLPDARRGAEYDRFVDDYGTHYANAITFGAKGERLLRMTQSQVMAMSDIQTDVSVGLTAGYLGNSGSVDVDRSRQNMQKITSNTSSEDRSWFCYSGGSCNDGIPSGDAVLPVQLDLRPISDLFAPPFFTDDTVLTTLRDGISRAVASKAFVRKDRLQQPAVVFASVTGFDRTNITSIGSDIQSMRTDSRPCGVSSSCNDGTVTLTSADGSVIQIPPTFAQQPTWRIPADLVPDGANGASGIVGAKFSWSGKCLNSTSTWTAAGSASTRVDLPALTVQPGNVSGMAFVTSPSCVTDSNPMGVVTVTGVQTITAVKSARALLEQR